MRYCQDKDIDKLAIGLVRDDGWIYVRGRHGRLYPPGGQAAIQYQAHLVIAGIAISFVAKFNESTKR